jgi:glycosyltransferase involved in cell wall biosynthesis
MNTTTDKLKSRILVVIPTLGERIDLLRKTLESIKLQTPVLYDIVIVYPLKNKEVKKLAHEFNATSVEDPGSLSSALNAGVASARPWHEFISWIGDDDLIAPNSYRTALDALDNNPSAVLAFGYCDYIDDNGKKLFTSRAGKIAPWLMTWGPNLVPCPGILFRLSSLQAAGPFDVNNKYSMDLEMLLRLRKLGKFINTKATLASFRWHSSSTTVSNRHLVLQETEAVKRKYLSRPLQLIAPLWEIPVRLATKIAAKRVSKITQRR